MIENKRYKAMLKSELAAAAGVSYGTFFRWLEEDEEYLKKYPDKKNNKLLTPAAVKFICEKYIIIFDD